MGWGIVGHSFGLVLRNWGPALRSSAVPLLLVIMAGWGAFAVRDLTTDPLTFAQAEGAEVARQAGPGGLSIVLALLVTLFCLAWIAVTWHRFVLLEEQPGFMPPLRGRPIWHYVGRSFVVGLVLFVAALPLGLIAGLIVAAAADGGKLPSPVLLLALNLVIGTLVTVVSLRIGIVLPGTALRRPLRIGEAWTATSPASGAIWRASAVLVALNIGVALLLDLLGTGWASLLVQIVTGWVSLMLGISVLTTLYGHLVEGRPLNG